MGNPQKNTYLQLMAAKQRIAELEQIIRDLHYHIDYMKGFTIQQCLDIAQLSNHREFGHGPVNQKRFETRFKNIFFEYAELCVSDGKDDETIEYTKSVMDRNLRAACGDDMRPFDERYAEENLYFRDRGKAWKEAAVE